MEKLWDTVKHGLQHTWDGIKLLVTNVRITWGILRKMRAGETLTRREQRLLMLTTADLVRMVCVFPQSESCRPFLCCVLTHHRLLMVVRKW